MFEVRNLSCFSENKVLFENVAFSIYPGEKVGLVGPNGSGKTSLLRLLAGEQEMVSAREKILGLTKEQIFYLDNQAVYFSNHSVASMISPQWNRLKNELEQLSEELGQSSQLLERYEDCYEQFEKLGGYGHEGRLEKLLHVLDLESVLLDKNLQSLSGGERMRVSMAAMLLNRFELALLDEPSNNLDLSAKHWLEEFILNRPEAFLIVSHDRALLDKVCSRILVLDPVAKTVTNYRGNYSWTESQIQTERARNQQHYQVQKRLINRLEEDVRETKNQALKTERSTTNDYIRRRSKKVALKAKAREARLTKIIETKKLSLVKEHKKACFEATDSAGSKAPMIVAKNLTVGFENHILIEGINLEICHGDRIAILGDNGTGKSCLLNTLLGDQVPLAGVLQTKSNIGYLTQGRAESFLSETVLDAYYLIASSNRECLSEDKARKQLSRILIRGSSLNYPVSKLSEGERTRLELAAVLMRKPSLLVLDEPTNHLDLDSILALEKTLLEFQGALIVVSHDQRLLNNLDLNYKFEIQNKLLKKLA